MDAELIERLRGVADEWERAAPPVSLQDVVAPRTPGEGTSVSPEVPVRELDRGRRWWWTGIAAAAAIAALVVGVAVLGRDTDHTVTPVDTQPTPSTDATSTTRLDTTTTEATEAAQFAALVDEVAAARASVESITATVTVTNSNPGIDPSGAPLPPDVVTRTNRVTMLSDGFMWSEGDPFLWSSFDASTGIARNAVVGADGATRYQEVVGWADASVPLNIMFGVDPFADVYGISVMAQDHSVTQSIEDVTSDLGRPAWRITQSTVETSSDESGGVTSFTSTWDIDRETGLVVAYSNVQTYSGVEQRTESRVTELTTDVTLPPEFPGSFPDGAPVDRSGDPNGYLPMPDATAAREFGRAIYVPEAFGDGALVHLATQRQAFGDSSEPNSTMLRVEVVRHVGFTTAVVTMFEYVLDPGAPVPAGAQMVDGLLCFAPTPEACGGGGATTVVTSGALAGAPSTAEGNTVSITVDGVNVSVRAATPTEALELANSLVRVDPAP